jgi:hypothetical protein
MARLEWSRCRCGFLRSRPGHGYLVVLEQTPVVPPAKDRALLHVVRPELFAADEEEYSLS